MNEKAFNDAVKIGKLMKILSPLWRTNKNTRADASRITSKVEECVCFLMEKPFLNKKISESEKERAVTVHTLLLEHILRHIIKYAASADLRCLIDSLETGKSAFGRSVFKKSEIHFNYRTELAAPVLNEANLVVDGGKLPIPNEVRGKLVHRYASIVKNEPWLDVLSAIGVPLGDAISFNARLSTIFASREGVAALEDNKAVFLNEVEAKPAKKRASSKKKVQDLSVDWPSVLDNPKPELIKFYAAISPNYVSSDDALKSLVNELSFYGWGTQVADVLKALFEPREVEPSSAEVEPSSAEVELGVALNKAYQELRQLYKKMQEEKVIKANERQKKEAAAVKKLVDSMGAGVRDILKKNPNLILEALKQQ